MPRDYSKLPPHMRAEMQAYLERGRRPSAFLHYILSNDFVSAAGHADASNQRYLFEYCDFLYNQCPLAAWGNGEKVVAWRGELTSEASNKPFST